jgi:hypothetical protein
MHRTSFVVQAWLVNLSRGNVTCLNGLEMFEPVCLLHGDIFTIVGRQFRFDYGTKHCLSVCLYCAQWVADVLRSVSLSLTLTENSTIPISCRNTLPVQPATAKGRVCQASRGCALWGRSHNCTVAQSDKEVTGWQTSNCRSETVVSVCCECDRARCRGQQAQESSSSHWQPEIEHRGAGSVQSAGERL